MTKELGKISFVKFGLGGYQDCCLGLTVSLEFSGNAVSDFTGYWDEKRMETDDAPENPIAKSTRDTYHAKTMNYVSKLLHDAKVDSVDKLKGKPIEATMEGNSLVSWRILSEVL